MVAVGNVLPSVKLGRERDAKIVDLIRESGPYNREQIQALLFPNHTGPQKCSQRLGKLVQRGRIKRLKFGDSGQYVYYADKWTQKSEHTLMVNWVYVALMTQRKSWFKVQAFVREYHCRWDGGEFWADALIVLTNTQTGALKTALVEVDRDPNRFSKVPRYAEYYCSNAWCGLWWAKKDAEGYHPFPRLLVVTERRERVLAAVERDNVGVDGKNKLRVTVAGLDEARGDLYRLL